MSRRGGRTRERNFNGVLVISSVIRWYHFRCLSFQAVVQPTYSRGNYTLFYATTVSSTEDGQLELDSIKEQVEGTSPQPPQLPHGNAYNPYDPDFAPIDGSAEIHIAAIGSTTTTTSTFSPITSPETETETEMDYDLLNSPPRNIPQTMSGSCPWKCELTNDRGYVLYSALGSFYIPMFVMLFFYWRIYRAAVRTTRAINQGFKTTKGKFCSSTAPSSTSVVNRESHKTQPLIWTRFVWTLSPTICPNLCVANSMVLILIRRCQPTYTHIIYTCWKVIT